MDFATLSVQAIVALAMVIATEKLRRWWFSPRLVLDFVPDHTKPYPSILEDGSCNRGSDGKQRFTKNARVVLTNASNNAAFNCRAYLSSIERSDGSGSWVLMHDECLQLPWAHQDKAVATNPITLPGQVRTAFDVFYVLSGENHVTVRALAKHFDWASLFATNATYRFNVVVTADNLTPGKLCFTFQWHNDYERVSVNSFEKCS